MHWYWQELAWDCYLSFFTNLYQNYGPWLMSVFSFSSSNGQNLTKFFICIDIDNIMAGTFTCHFWQICNSYGLRVISEWCQNFCLIILIIMGQIQPIVFVCIDNCKDKVWNWLYIMHVFCKLSAESWPLIDVNWDFYAHLSFYSMRHVAKTYTKHL